jgi:hypothetical protein
MGSEEQMLPDIFEGLPVNEDDWPAEIKEDLKLYAKAHTEEGGLIPSAACRHIFGVSRQRWHAMCKEYMFKTWTLFDKKWFSANQLKQFHKLDRSEYGGKGKGVDMAAMARDCLADAVDK